MAGVDVQYTRIRGVGIVALFIHPYALFLSVRSGRKKKTPLICVSIFRTLRETMEKNQESKAKYGDAIVEPNNFSVLHEQAMTNM